MKMAFWAYGADSDGPPGSYAGFCAFGQTVGFEDCVVIDVVEMKTWNEARRHGNFLGDFRPEDSVTAQDEPLVQG